MITTHVLDVSLGKPARGVPITLEISDGSGWRVLGQGKTDDDGRLRTLLQPGTPLAVTTYRLRFDTKHYFDDLGVQGFYPLVEVVFAVRDPGGHYHVPLLLSPFGYSTYRGS